MSNFTSFWCLYKMEINPWPWITEIKIARNRREASGKRRQN